MSLKNFIEEIMEVKDIETAKSLLTKAYLTRAKLRNRIFQIELENIDFDSRTSIEKQQMKIAKTNEEYRQLLMDLELIKAGINALEIFLKIYEKSKQEVF